ncbi:MAG: ATP-binding protein [Bacteroidales bacterium]|nr:MAG: ATP-binding protein [Bacteroidales bacterium]
MSKYIKRLISQGEHQQLDFKFEISDAKKIARTFSAFANTKGGKLLVGVKDNGVIAGIRTDEEDYMIESAAHLYCRPAIKYTTKKWHIEGRWILEVSIPESERKPHYARNEEGKWLAYLRVDDQNFLANRILLRVWKKRTGKKPVFLRYREAEKKLLEYLRCNEKITLSEFLKTVKINKFRAENILVNLISIGVLRIEFTEKEVFYNLKEPVKV